jgi:hypothetical protein
MRLAAVYASGLTLLFLAFGLSIGRIRDLLRDLEMLAIPASVCFGAAFVLLAIGRRLGFTALWLSILGFWALFIFGYQSHGLRAGIGFVLWSFMAAPLYVIVRAGFQRTATAGSGKLAAGFAVWGSLFLAGVLLEDWPPALTDAERPWLAIVPIIVTAAWCIAPVVVTALAIRHVHRSIRLAAPA